MEQAFGALKNRFKILTSRPFFSFETQADITIVYCFLHNYIYKEVMTYMTYMYQILKNGNQIQMCVRGELEPKPVKK